MEYSNPELPEGINTSQSSPLKEFAILTFGVIGVILLLVTLLIVIVDYFADKIPFEWEQGVPLERVIDTKGNQHLPEYIDQLSRNVINKMSLPEGMEITVHYVNDDLVNAFATLGGHIVLYRGLLEKLNSEDELAMVIAHEVAHVKYRHPILSASHVVVVGVVLSLIGSSSGDDVISNLLGTTGMVSLMKYSRDYEYEADADAINALISLYGHADGAIDLFGVFKSEMGKAQPLEFLSTHPLTGNRISQTQAMIDGHDVATKNQMTLLPQEFVKWLASEKASAKE